jgi:type II secretory pathway pseudopilin PulG
MRHSRKFTFGFTTIELLVVVTIIVALLAILIPSITHMKKQALKAGSNVQLSNLRTGLAQYYNDFNVYPPSTGAFGPIAAEHGASRLAQGLLGYLPGNIDGAGSGLGANSDATDFGFRINKNAVTMGMGGKIYGPYASTDPKDFKPSPAGSAAFIDQWENDIIYYRSNYAGPNTPRPTGTIFGASNSYFNNTDCRASVTSRGSAANPPTSPGPFFTLIASSNSHGIQGPIMGSSDFLLISAGPDELYFTADDIVVSK